MPRGAETMAPELAGATRYYAWVFDAIAPFLGERILDIGGGHGSHLEPVLGSGRSVVSLDLSEDAAEAMRTRYRNQGSFRALSGEFQSADIQRRLLDLEFDTILCLNVLEHIEDDQGALSLMRTLLARRGGNVVLQVPAHPWLYGRLDTLAGHHRRYTAAQLRGRLAGAGFQDGRIAYFNRFGVLPWLVNGRILKPERIDAASVDAQVKIFDRYLVPLARILEKMLALPLGQSLIAIAAVEREHGC